MDKLKVRDLSEENRELLENLVSELDFDIVLTPNKRLTFLTEFWLVEKAKERKANRTLLEQIEQFVVCVDAPKVTAAQGAQQQRKSGEQPAAKVIDRTTLASAGHALEREEKRQHNDEQKQIEKAKELIKQAGAEKDEGKKIKLMQEAAECYKSANALSDAAHVYAAISRLVYGPKRLDWLERAATAANSAGYHMFESDAYLSAALASSYHQKRQFYNARSLEALSKAPEYSLLFFKRLLSVIRMDYQSIERFVGAKDFFDKAVELILLFCATCRKKRCRNSPECAGRQNFLRSSSRLFQDTQTSETNSPL